MNLNDFDVAIETLRPHQHMCRIKRKSEDTWYGITVQAPQPPPPAWVLNQFTTQYRAFFVDITSEILPVTGSSEIPTTDSGSI